MTHTHRTPRPADLSRQARVVTHDSANWLTVAQGHAQRLLDALPDQLDTAALAGLRTSIDACVALRAAFLGQADGEPVEARTRIDLADRLGPLAAALTALARPGVKMVADLPPDLHATVAVQGLTNAVANLLTNALHHTTSGSVTLSLEAAESTVAVRVADTGVGMDAATLERCRRLGFSGRGSTGLGLAEVDAFARRNGATLHIQSQEGQGTRVDLVMPRADHTRSRSDSEVLLVEDDPGVAEMLLDWFPTLGVGADHVWQGADALERLATSRYAVVLIDRGLPDVDGLELAKQIRQTHPSVGIVLLTGDRADRPLDASNVDEVLHKPVDFDHLQRALWARRQHHDPHDSHPDSST